MLKKRGHYESIKEASKGVAKTSGLECTAIKNFRNTINRGLYADEVLKGYKRMFASFRLGAPRKSCRL